MQYYSNNAIDNSPTFPLIVVVTIFGILLIKFILYKINQYQYKNQVQNEGGEDEDLEYLSYAYKG
jgi:hypothetical protein